MLFRFNNKAASYCFLNNRPGAEAEAANLRGYFLQEVLQSHGFANSGKQLCKYAASKISPV